MNIIRTFCAMLASVFAVGAAEAQAESVDVAIRAEQDCVEVADLKAASRWYARSLGFRIVSTAPDEVWLERDGEPLRLAPGSVSPVRFEVDSLAAALARPGMTVIAGPSITRDPPRKVAAVRAADGSRVELYERLDRWRG